MSNQGLNEDTLFLACTRPAMIAGVTMEAMGINVIVTCLVFILAGNIFYALIGIIFHLILRALCKYDHNMFRVLVSYLETKGRCRNTKFWGGSWVSPLKVARRTMHELPPPVGCHRVSIVRRPWRIVATRWRYFSEAPFA